jgi:uncharacterized protein (TIGR01777 family)
MKTVIIIGATGLIGKALSKKLIEKGYGVIAFSRNPKKGQELLDHPVRMVQWDGKTSSGWTGFVENSFAIINLAGENISSGRWTQAKKTKILQSRLDAGAAVALAVKQAKKKPSIVIQASGIGFYGSHADEIIDESFAPGSGFLSMVAEKWEMSTREVESYGTRHIIIRTGVVLGKDGGAFPRLIKPFRFFFGGPLGSGKQWFPWIHLNDEVGAICFLLESEGLHGTFNLSVPEPIRMKDFCHLLGKVIKRPSWLKVPGFLLGLIFGEMADEVLLSGQRAIPKRLLEAGYRFAYPDAESALVNILGL